MLMVPNREMPCSSSADFLPPAQLTIMALREAELPEGCTRTIYMCDDGKDPLKHDWVESLPEDVIYVSGRRSTPVTQGEC